MAQISFRPLSPTFGAEARNVDLSAPLTEDLKRQLRDGWHKYKVLVFRDQPIGRREHLELGRVFGVPEVHPAYRNAEFPEILEIKANAGETHAHWKSYKLGWWHTDVSFQPKPPSAAILRAVQLPPAGGDTGFLDAAAAYARLDDEMKDRINGLFAEHSPGFERQVSDPDKVKELDAANPPSIHPVVTVHPDTGERILFVNEYFTTRIVGVDELESERLLNFLLRHIQKPEFQLRVQWQPNSLVLWDERATQHYAIKDYSEARHLERVTLAGTAPQPVADRESIEESA